MRACAVIQLASDSTIGRIRADVPEIIAVLQRFSEKSELAFRSHDGALFGFYIKTEKPLGMIHMTIRNGPNFVNGDSIIIFEIGEDSEGSGFARQLGWIQHTAK